MGEVFDAMSKRSTLRRQKRWWNAYMLFYTRQDVEDNSFLKCLEQLTVGKLVFNNTTANFDYISIRLLLKSNVGF